MGALFESVHDQPLFLPVHPDGGSADADCGKDPFRIVPDGHRNAVKAQAVFLGEKRRETEKILRRLFEWGKGTTIEANEIRSFEIPCALRMRGVHAARRAVSCKPDVLHTSKSFESFC